VLIAEVSALMPQRNPKNVSFGVFASASSASFLKKEDVEKHFFSTSSGREHYERKLEADDISENFIHIHNAGKTYGKYLPYQRCKAPLLDRDSCTSSIEFNKKPCLTLQFEANSKIADSFKPVRTKAKPSIKVGSWESHTKNTFAGQTTSELRGAKPDLWKPPAENGLEAVLGGGWNGKLMVTKSHLQTTHHGDFSKAPRAAGEAFCAPSGSISLQGYHSGDFHSSSYHSDFNGHNRHRSQAVGSAFRLLQRSSSEPGHIKLQKTL